MAPEVVIFFTVGKCRGKDRAFRRAQAAVVKESFFPERSCLPAFHTCCGNSDPIDPARFIGDVSANLFETTTPKKLAPTGNVILTLETVLSRTVPFFVKDRPGDTQIWIFLEFFQQEFEIICVE